MRIQRLEPLLVVLCVMGYTIWYLAETLMVSLNAQNILFVLPLSVLVFGLGLVVLWYERRNLCKNSEEDRPPVNTATLQMMVVSAAYVFSMDFIGFDVASFLFMAALIRIGGQRGLVSLIVFPLVFTVLVVMFFTAMLPYPIPVLVDFKTLLQ